MTTIIRRLVGGALLLVPAAVSTACASSKPHVPTTLTSVTEFESHLQRLVDDRHVPGVSVVVVSQDQELYARGFGLADGPRELPADEDTIYQWWSLTKPITAVAVLQLVEAGQVELDAPIAQYLPFVQFDGGSSTVRQVLSHSSGLGDVGIEILGWIHYEGDAHPVQSELARSVIPEHRELAYTPGSEGRYSNLGYILLAALIEQVSGVRYERYVAERIFEPLQMTHAGFEYRAELAAHEAAGSHPTDWMGWFALRFCLDEERAIRERRDGRYWFHRVYSNQQGATGALGSARDLGRFLRALLRGGELDGQRILSAHSVRLMAEPVVAVTQSPVGARPGMHFGLGWFRFAQGGEQVLAHGGSGMAFQAMLQLHPERALGVAMLSNGTHSDGEGGSRITRALASLDWSGVDDAQASDRAPSAAATPGAVQR